MKPLHSPSEARHEIHSLWCGALHDAAEGRRAARRQLFGFLVICITIALVSVACVEFRP